MIRRLYRAHFTDRENIFDRETLLRLASEVGLDRKSVVDNFDSKAFIAEVFADENKARTVGVRSVPTLLVNGHILIGGTQSPEEIANVFKSCDSKEAI